MSVKVLCQERVAISESKNDFSMARNDIHFHKYVGTVSIYDVMCMGTKYKFMIYNTVYDMLRMGGSALQITSFYPSSVSISNDADLASKRMPSSGICHQTSRFFV